jgi:beta-mannosidase
VTSAIEVDGHSQRHWNAATLLGGFRDLTNAYRFGPPSYDLVRARLEVGDDVSEDFYLPLGPSRPQEPDLGLEAKAALEGDCWHVTLRTRRFAQWVALEVPGFVPNDSWFHLAPGAERAFGLRPLNGDAGASPRGRVRALNSFHSSAITIEE